MRVFTPCLVLMALALGACGNEGPRPLVFSAGGAPAEVAAFRELAARYSAGVGHVKVEFRALPADSDLQWQYYTAALGTGRAPFDVLRVDGIWLAPLGSKHWLRPLAPLLSKGFTRAFDPGLIAAASPGGSLLALPWNADVGLLYSRKDLLRAVGAKGPPRSLAALTRLAAEVLARRPKGASLAGFVWQGKAYEGLTCDFLEAYTAYGGNARSVDRRGCWSYVPALKALRHLRGLIQSGISPPNTATELTEEPCRLLFQGGRAVFMRNWSYAAPLLQGKDSAVKGKVWVSPMPGGSTLGGWYLAVRQGSRRARQAAAFVAWLTSRTVEQGLAKSLGWNPTRADAARGLSPSREPQLAAVRAALPTAVSRPSLPDYAAFSEKTYETVNEVLLGDLGASEAARRLSRP